MTMQGQADIDVIVARLLLPDSRGIHRVERILQVRSRIPLEFSLTQHRSTSRDK
jgi:hypothetical protein